VERRTDSEGMYVPVQSEAEDADARDAAGLRRLRKGAKW
jgi:hypothetical protein